MIVLPAVISLVAIGSISYVVMQAFGITPGSHLHSGDIDFFQDTLSLADTWADDLSALEIERALEDVLEDFPKKGASLYIYRDGEVLLSRSASEGQAAAASALLAQSGEYAYIMDGTLVMKEDAGAYTLIGVQKNYLARQLYDSSLRFRMLTVAAVILCGVVAVILTVNSLLTRMISRHIMVPLSTLADGVRQIADGNLGYRINYASADEFAPVMDDFNDMAAHLQAMVAARQRDDESRRELIAGISHDLRTPLTSIIGYVEGLEKGIAATPAMQSRYLSIIHEQADILSHTINQLFLFTKLDTDRFPMHMERIDLMAELRTYAELVSDAYAARGLGIDLSPQEGPVWVRADRVQLRNVLTNVLENSVKYGKKGGGRMDIRCEATAQDAIITLTDDGPGVPDAALKRLFSVFYRSDASRQHRKDGSGLGLAISARIIGRLGGTIAAANASPSGLSIRITLPTLKEDEPRAKDTDHRG